MDNNNLHALLRTMVECGTSDLYLTTGAAPKVKIDGKVQTLPLPSLQSGQVRKLAYSALTPQAIADFERTMEWNMSYAPDGIGRFRVNIYQQRGETALIARQVNAQMPGFENLGLPPAVRDLAMLPRGLILIVGAAGSGKTTTMASMVDYRATHHADHIRTVENPIEYLFKHGESTVDQREVGVDTLSFSSALRNAIRQSPDMIVIGEIRDQETMQQAIVSQRLLPNLTGQRVLATEVLLHSAHVADLIQCGAVDGLRESLEKTSAMGTHSFDQSLLDLFQRGLIDQETALVNADSRTDLGLRMRLHSSHDPH